MNRVLFFVIIIFSFLTTNAYASVHFDYLFHLDSQDLIPLSFSLASFQKFTDEIRPAQFIHLTKLTIKPSYATTTHIQSSVNIFDNSYGILFAFLMKSRPFPVQHFKKVEKKNDLSFSFIKDRELVTSLLYYSRDVAQSVATLNVSKVLLRYYTTGGKPVDGVSPLSSVKRTADERSSYSANAMGVNLRRVISVLKIINEIRLGGNFSLPQLAAKPATSLIKNFAETKQKINSSFSFFKETKLIVSLSSLQHYPDEVFRSVAINAHTRSSSLKNHYAQANILTDVLLTRVWDAIYSVFNRFLPSPFPIPLIYLPPQRVVEKKIISPQPTLESQKNTKRVPVVTQTHTVREITHEIIREAPHVDGLNQNTKLVDGRIAELEQNTKLVDGRIAELEQKFLSYNQTLIDQRRTIALTNSINQLSGVTITNTIFSGAQNNLNILDADVPDTITVSNYLALKGGTITGSLSFANRSTTTIPNLLAGAFSIATSTSAEAPFFTFDTLNSRIGIGTSSPGATFSVQGDILGTGVLNIVGNGTSTFQNGINVVSGCFAIGGTCVGGGSGSGTVGSGTTGQFPYYAGAGTTLTATSSLFLATSGTVGIGTTTPGTLL